MTPQPTAAVAARDRTMPPDGRHQHSSACFWNVDECRWQCATSRGLRYALVRRPIIGRLVEHTGSRSGRERHAAHPDSVVSRSQPASGSMQPSTA